MDQSKVVVVRSFATVGEALICQSLLESAGIACKLLGETISSVLPLQNEYTEVYVAVLGKDLEKAEEILSAKFDQQEYDEESAKRRRKP